MSGETTEEMLARVAAENLEWEVRSAHEFDEAREPEGDPSEPGHPDNPRSAYGADWPPMPHFRILEVPAAEPTLDQLAYGGQMEVAEYHANPPEWATTISIWRFPPWLPYAVGSLPSSVYVVSVGGTWDRGPQGDINCYSAGAAGWRSARMRAVECLESLIAADIGRWKASIANS